MTKRIDIQVSRTIQASPEEIFDVWLDTKSPGGPWFGAKRVILDAKVDGLFYHAVEHAGREWAHYGRFVRLERGRVIEHTWMSEATSGVETVVTTTFEKKGDATVMTLDHRNVPDDELGRQHGEGWNWMADAIAARFASRAR